MVVKVAFRESFKASISVLAASAARLLSVSLSREKCQKTFGEQKGQSDDYLVTNVVEHTGYGHRRERGLSVADVFSKFSQATRSEPALRETEFGHRRGLERVKERRDAGDVLVNVAQGSTRERILVQDESSDRGASLDRVGYLVYLGDLEVAISQVE